MKLSFILIVITSVSANAAFTVNLSGNTEYAGWNNLRNSNPYWSANNYPTSYPGIAGWPSPVSPNRAGSEGSAALMKISGNGYFSGSSIYDAGSPGRFSITDLSPIMNLATVVFQIDAGTTVGLVPILNYNGGSQALAADYSAQGDGAYQTLNFQTGQSFPTVNHAWQWDLTGIQVMSYEIVWGSAPNNHLTQYEFGLATSDTFTRVVPEPSSLILVSFCLFAIFRRRR